MPRKKNTLVSFPESVPPEEVLHELWQFAPDRYYGGSWSGYSSIGKARKELDQHDYVDYYLHRPIKVDFSTYPILDSRLYDRDAGEGTMASVRSRIDWNLQEKKRKEDNKERMRIATERGQKELEEVPLPGTLLTRESDGTWKLDSRGKTKYNGEVIEMIVGNKKINSLSSNELRHLIDETGLGILLEKNPDLERLRINKREIRIPYKSVFRTINQQVILNSLSQDESVILESSFPDIAIGLYNYNKDLILPLASLFATYSDLVSGYEHDRANKFADALVSYMESALGI